MLAKTYYAAKFYIYLASSKWFRFQLYRLLTPVLCCDRDHLLLDGKKRPPLVSFPDRSLRYSRASQSGRLDTAVVRGGSFHDTRICDRLLEPPVTPPDLVHNLSSSCNASSVDVNLHNNSSTLHLELVQRERGSTPTLNNNSKERQLDGNKNCSQNHNLLLRQKYLKKCSACSFGQKSQQTEHPLTEERENSYPNIFVKLKSLKYDPT